ncbi:cytosol aminopeptidase family protein [Mucilaginibacter frigoritolerans]|uniref:Cytosol aminopeptidase family protein n=1 Tax=Mucilaginibacter frigoritolerans TaxID=652788 RepID=A0A562TS14_9SPHI|nr:M17 family peptidase N-terminal domain-containing protein [Mucilaginibacter frigoritolerans]TWI95856.1 cytosol aminopeptidase family protein [Mucilaginibacter frigoritolerans]
MKNSITKLFRLSIITIAIVLAGFSISYAQTPAKPLPAVGTSVILGQIDGVKISATVQSPSNQQTPLQVICVFEYTEGDIFNSPPALPRNVNGLVHVDDALKGILTELRKSGQFAGHALETILITPLAGSMPAKRLLIIGLGDRNKFNAELMNRVGSVEMHEALRLGVSSYSHASDLKDAGIDSPTDSVAVNIVKGAMEAYKAENFLKDHSLTSFQPIDQITLLAGPAFFQVSSEAIKVYIATLKK